MEKIKLTIEVEVGEEKIAELFSTAFYGGVNYWCSRCINDSIPKEIKEYNLSYEDELAKCLFTYPDYSFKIMEGDEYDDSIDVHSITLDKIQNGLNKMAIDSPEIMSSFLEDGFDAQIADCVFQYIVFGEIIYG